MGCHTLLSKLLYNYAREGTFEGGMKDVDGVLVCIWSVEDPLESYPVQITLSNPICGFGKGGGEGALMEGCHWLGYCTVEVFVSEELLEEAIQLCASFFV